MMETDQSVQTELTMYMMLVDYESKARQVDGLQGGDGGGQPEGAGGHTQYMETYRFRLSRPWCWEARRRPTWDI